MPWVNLPSCLLVGILSSSHLARLRLIHILNIRMPSQHLCALSCRAFMCSASSSCANPYYPQWWRALPKTNTHINPQQQCRNITLHRAHLFRTSPWQTEIAYSLTADSFQGFYHESVLQGISPGFHKRLLRIWPSCSSTHPLRFRHSKL